MSVVPFEYDNADDRILVVEQVFRLDELGQDKGVHAASPGFPTVHAGAFLFGCSFLCLLD